MLYVTHKSGRCHPVVRCHVCDKTVRDVGDAMVVYPASIDEGHTVRVCIVHAGACLDQVTETLANEHGSPQSLPLDEYLSRMRESDEVSC
jgi:hypothetical protein